MLPIDMLSAFAIGGMGAFVGALMMLIAMQGERSPRAALLHCFWGFVILGAGLAQNGFLDRTPRWPILLGALAALVGSLLVSHGTVAIATGAAPPRRAPVEAAVLALAVVLAWPQGPHVFGVAVHALGLMVATRATFAMRAALLRPRSAAEAAVAGTFAVYAATWIYTLVAAARHDGPELRHLVYVPEPLLTVYAVTYALMPLVVGSLILNLVNARLGERLRRQAGTDQLTGLLSRRALFDRADRWSRGVRGGGRTPVLMLIDVDHFKNINDTRGHDAGDAVLRALSQRMRGQLRREAQLGRYGGEEFLAMVDAADPAEAQAVADRLRRAVGATPFVFGGQDLAVTVSIGTAAWHSGEAFAQAVARADGALYAAKAGGRDRAVAAAGPRVSAPAAAAPGTP
jgi:diguanylate cyclase (GGDEF)-like protein